MGTRSGSVKVRSHERLGLVTKAVNRSDKTKHVSDSCSYTVPNRALSFMEIVLARSGKNILEQSQHVSAGYFLNLGRGKSGIGQ